VTEAPTLFTDGCSYERMMGRWSRPVGEQFLDWLAVPKGLKWLDVGCGNGAFTEAIIARAAPAEVTGIDPAEGQLAYARTRPGAKLAQFQVAGAQALPFPDNCFDVAIMALVITFVPDPLAAVREMARVVKPGGWVATYMWDTLGGGFPLRSIRSALMSLGLNYPDSPGVEASRQEAMRGFWEKAALQSIETRVIRIQPTFDNFDDFWDSGSAPGGPAGKAIEALSPKQRDELKALLRKQLPPASDGRISFEAHANAVKGRVPA
jgi:ubiquinone/menaquinone biosynthesis C-methylase UbiE